MVPDHLRNLEGSGFYEYMNEFVTDVADINENGFQIRIKDMWIEADKALLFNKDWIIWGEMELRSYRRKNSTDNFVAYSDKFLDYTNQTQIAEFDEFIIEEWPDLRE